MLWYILYKMGNKYGLEQEVRGVEVDYGVEEREHALVHTEKESDRYKDYQFRIDWPNCEPYDDPENAAVGVRIETRDGEEYSTMFTTPRFINYMFEKNKRTGELLSGTYFCMLGMVVVERITEQTVKSTIDDLIDMQCVEDYFTRLEEKSDYFIERLKDLKRGHESSELTAGATYAKLVQLEEEFAKIEDNTNEEVSDEFYTLYGDLELLCEDGMESKRVPT